MSKQLAEHSTYVENLTEQIYEMKNQLRKAELERDTVFPTIIVGHIYLGQRKGSWYEKTVRSYRDTFSNIEGNFAF